MAACSTLMGKKKGPPRDLGKKRGAGAGGLVTGSGCREGKTLTKIGKGGGSLPLMGKKNTFIFSGRWSFVRAARVMARWMLAAMVLRKESVLDMPDRAGSVQEPRRQDPTVFGARYQKKFHQRGVLRAPRVRGRSGDARSSRRRPGGNMVVGGKGRAGDRPSPNR